MSIPTGKISAQIQNENGKIKVTKKETKTENITFNNVNRRLPDDGLVELNSLDGLDGLDGLEEIEEIEEKQEENISNKQAEKDKKKEWSVFWKYRIKDDWWYIRKYIDDNDVPINEFIDRNMVYNQYITFLRNNYGKDNKDVINFVSGKEVFIEKEAEYNGFKYKQYILSFEKGPMKSIQIPQEEGKEEYYGPVQMQINDLINSVEDYINSNAKFKKGIEEGTEMIPEIFYLKGNEYVNLDHTLEKLFLHDILNQDLKLIKVVNPNNPDKEIQKRNRELIFRVFRMANSLVDKENDLRMKYKKAYEKDFRGKKKLDKYEIRVPVRLISTEIQVKLDDEEIPDYGKNVFINIDYKYKERNELYCRC